MRLRGNRQAGYSTIELLVVLAIAGVLAAMALPSTARTLADVRLHNDARALHNLLSLAKMRASSKFTRVRLNCDLANETFVLETFDKTAGIWVTEENPQTLNTGVDFGFDAMTEAPVDTQDVLGQAALCKAPNGDDINNTACIVFNSRGIPVDSAGNPDGNGAIYITDHETGVYGVTVSATPLVRLWWSPTATTAWAHK
jgi:prepilin-type N-terminal cleavage/methylation domain-containing protein